MSHVRTNSQLLWESLVKATLFSDSLYSNVNPEDWTWQDLKLTSDIHVKRHSDSIHGVADRAGVPPFICSFYRVESENAATVGGKYIWWQQPGVQGAGVSHSRAVQL